MTQEIIKMARQAGLSNPLWIENDYAIIEAFAKLVAEREREACAKRCEIFAKHVKSSDAKEAANTCAVSIRTIGDK